MAVLTKGASEVFEREHERIKVGLNIQYESKSREISGSHEDVVDLRRRILKIIVDEHYTRKQYEREQSNSAEESLKKAKVTNSDKDNELLPNSSEQAANSASASNATNPQAPAPRAQAALSYEKAERKRLDNNTESDEAIARTLQQAEDGNAENDETAESQKTKVRKPSASGTLDTAMPQDDVARANDQTKYKDDNQVKRDEEYARKLQEEEAEVRRAAEYGEHRDETTVPKPPPTPDVQRSNANTDKSDYVQIPIPMDVDDNDHDRREQIKRDKEYAHSLSRTEEMRASQNDLHDDQPISPGAHRDDNSLTTRAKPPQGAAAKPEQDVASSSLPSLQSEAGQLQLQAGQPFYVDKFLYAYERRALKGKFSDVLIQQFRCTFKSLMPGDALAAKALYVELKCTPRVEEAIKAYAAQLDAIRSHVATIVIPVPPSLVSTIGEAALEAGVQHHLQTLVTPSSASLTQFANVTSVIDRDLVHVCQTDDAERAAFAIRQYICQKVQDFDTTCFETRPLDVYRSGVFEVVKGGAMRDTCTIVVFNADMTRVPANIYVNSVNTGLNLSGGLAQVLAKVAGPELQRDLDKLGDDLSRDRNAGASNSQSSSLNLQQ